MHSSTLSLLIVAVVLCWVVAVTSLLLVHIVRGGRNARFFALRRPALCHSFGCNGLSLLYRDTGDDERLQNLLAVEYPDYEVIVIADSMRNYDSLWQIITKYRMIAVDGRAVVGERATRVRKMYRSASRCYRRLLLLDVETSDCRSDFDVAYDVASYDYLLPLWGNERLRTGAIERAMADMNSSSRQSSDVITSRVGAPLQLISRRAASRVGGVSEVSFEGCRCLYEPLLVDDRGASLWWRAVAYALPVLILLLLGMAVVGIMPLAMVALALMLSSLVVATYAAVVAMSYAGEPAVGYVEMLSLFCENLLPGIWKIRK